LCEQSVRLRIFRAVSMGSIFGITYGNRFFIKILKVYVFAEEKIMALEVRKILTTDDDIKEILEIITFWMYNWWGKREAYDFNAVKSYVSHSFQDKRLPQTYGLFLDKKIIGMYQLTHEDLFARPDIYPWLANVYIAEEYRKKGYGKILLETIKTNAQANLFYEELFLYTTHVGLYEKYGWEFVYMIDTFQQEDNMQRLYRLSLR